MFNFPSNINGLHTSEPHNYEGLHNSNPGCVRAIILNKNRDDDIGCKYDIKLLDGSDTILPGVRLLVPGAGYNGVGKYIPLEADTPVIVQFPSSILGEGEGIIIGGFNTEGDYYQFGKEQKIPKPGEIVKGAEFNPPTLFANKVQMEDSWINVYPTKTLTTPYDTPEFHPVGSEERRNAHHMPGSIEMRTIDGDYINYTLGSNVNFCEDGDVIIMSGGIRHSVESKALRLCVKHLRKSNASRYKGISIEDSNELASLENRLTGRLNEAIQRDIDGVQTDNTQTDIIGIAQTSIADTSETPIENILGVNRSTSESSKEKKSTIDRTNLQRFLLDLKRDKNVEGLYVYIPDTNVISGFLGRVVVLTRLQELFLAEMAYKKLKEDTSIRGYTMFPVTSDIRTRDNYPKSQMNLLEAITNILKSLDFTAYNFIIKNLFGTPDKYNKYLSDNTEYNNTVANSYLPASGYSTSRTNIWDGVRSFYNLYKLSYNSIPKTIFEGNKNNNYKYLKANYEGFSGLDMVNIALVNINEQDIIIAVNGGSGARRIRENSMSKIREVTNLISEYFKDV